MMEIQPVILCGGSGTRLWPLSRQAYPKQFLPLSGDSSLLQQTVSRLGAVAGQDLTVLPAMVVCNEDHRFLVAEQLRSSDAPQGAIVLEPVGRNTAPALTAAALQVSEGGQDPLLLVMPADHLIGDTAAFGRAVQVAAGLASEGRLVTFGIVPDSPETGYGYIRRGAEISSGAFELDAFVEKPDRATAEQYLASGDYLWNSGMFMMRASVWLAEIERHRGDILAACRTAMQGTQTDGDFVRLDRAAFENCPGDSIDYAVMEKIAAPAAAVVALDADWSDIGAWSALWEVGDQDAAGNVVRGDIVVEDSRNSLLYSQHRLLAVVGVDDLVVVETPDAVLIAHKDRTQDVRAITDILKRQERQELEFHRCVHRPWGSYESVDSGPRFQVKRLTVKPGATLSLQMHHHRAEHWIVVSGTARVTRGDDVFMLSENESPYIPLGTRHRLENPGTIPLEIIEVQSGSYLGEDDIVRFEDVYQRT